MRRFFLSLFLMLGVVLWARADTSQKPGEWDWVSVPPMKTSIYVGSVSMITSQFKRDGDEFKGTYEARVRPWFFWSESGRIAIKITAADLARLAKGERVEFTGEAFNTKEKPRKVSGYAERADSATGKIKVKIGADGYELIFNGSYRFDNAVK